MNEEEKEAIEQIKYLIEFTKDICLYSTEHKSYKIVLNYIDKLQKEIEINCISKDIIRNKIKELEERDKMFKLELPEGVTIYQYGIEVLKELLGE